MQLLVSFKLWDIYIRFVGCKINLKEILIVVLLRSLRNRIQAIYIHCLNICVAYYQLRIYLITVDC